MKFATVILLLVLAAWSARGESVAFQRRYVSDIRGHHETGCFIDSARNVFLFENETERGTPPHRLGQMSEAAFARAQELLAIVAAAPYDSKTIATDAGQTTWTGLQDQQAVTIREFGDVQGDHEGDAGAKLVELIEAFCPRM